MICYRCEKDYGSSEPSYNPDDCSPHICGDCDGRVPKCVHAGCDETEGLVAMPDCEELNKATRAYLRERRYCKKHYPREDATGSWEHSRLREVLDDDVLARERAYWEAGAAPICVGCGGTKHLQVTNAHEPELCDRILREAQRHGYHGVDLDKIFALVRGPRCMGCWATICEMIQVIGPDRSIKSTPTRLTAWAAR